MSEAVGKVIKVPKGEIPNIYIEREYNNQSELRKAFQEHQRHMVEIKESLTKIEIDLKETDGDLRVKSQERQSIEKLRDGMVDEIRDSRDRLIAYLGGTTSVKDSIAIVKTKVNTLRKEIENIQRDYLTAKEDLAKIIERVKGLEQRFNAAKKEWESMAVKLERLSDEERAYSEADLRKLEEDYETIRNELGIVQRSLGAIESKISELKKKIAEVEELRKAVLLKRNQKTLYGNLAQDLQNNRLQNYVVGRLLETLIGTCNRTLKDLTRNRYTLDLNEKENMIVRDSWNGDEQRPVETLSGGETFVIALSLALSLSEFMKGGVSLESLFLDEGFSNLDRQRLDLVSDALGNLPLYGKVVGVITHLEELAERFPVRVHVKNSPEGSSITVATI
jgi:exonuclease SbcC